MRNAMSREFAVAFLREHGFGLPADKHRAHAWVLDRAREGNLDAQCVLATLYWTGLTGSPDEALAYEWCQVAAESGSQDAQCALASHLVSGAGSGRDAERGVRMLQDLVAAGHLPAMVSLGLLFLSGGCEAVPKDPKAALDVLLRPAQADDGLSQCLLGMEMMLDPDPLVQRQGLAWIELAAVNGSATAHRYLAGHYRSGGAGFEISLEKAEVHESMADSLDADAT